MSIKGEMSMKINPHDTISNLWKFVKSNFLTLLLCSVWIVILQQLSYYFFSHIDKTHLYFFARHIETIIIGGVLIFFILLHFKVCVKFDIKYFPKEFIFLKGVFYIIFNAIALYMAILFVYLFNSKETPLFIIASLYANVSIWGCLFSNAFFNKKAKAHFIKENKY